MSLAPEGMEGEKGQVFPGLGSSKSGETSGTSPGPTLPSQGDPGPAAGGSGFPPALPASSGAEDSMDKKEKLWSGSIKGSNFFS